MSKIRNIHERKFSGSAVPVGSAIGRVLINSQDSRKVADAIRAAIRGENKTITLSPSTTQAIKVAADCD